TVMFAAFMRRSCMAMAMPDNGLPEPVPGKMKSLVRVSFKAVRMAMARSDKGTRCAFPAFMRLPGITQTAFARSTSSHPAFLTSPERQAVRMANSKVRAPWTGEHEAVPGIAGADHTEGPHDARG